MSVDFRHLAPGDHCLHATVANDRRSFCVHVPEHLDVSLNPVVALDGITLWNQKGNMGGINGLDAASDKYKFATIYPVPKTRYFGILAGWNTLGAYLAYRSEYDDIDFLREVFAMLCVGRAYAIGFSAGAQFAHILAGRLAGTIAGVASVCGTWLGTEPSPPSGTALLVIHGEEDPVQPYRGESHAFRVRLLASLGNRNVMLSRPDLQAQTYAAANGYSLEPEVEQTPIFVKRTFGHGPVPVVEYMVRHPYGRHAYHGRQTGKGTESVLSRIQGRPAPPGMFSVNEVFATTMGFAK